MQGKSAVRRRSHTSLSFNSVADPMAVASAGIRCDVAVQRNASRPYLRSSNQEMTWKPNVSKDGVQQEGTYFEGVSEVAGSKISLAREPTTIWEDPLSKLATLRTDLTIDRGMSFEVRRCRAGSLVFVTASKPD